MVVVFYPLDFDTLEKGTVIPREKVEEIMGVKFTSPRYQFKLMALVDMIQRGLKKRGLLWTVVIRGDQVRILTDAEAVEHNQKQTERGRRKMTRAFVRNRAVDVSQLSEEQKQTHERQLLNQGRMLQAMRVALRAIKSEAHQRQTPGLPAPDKQ